MLGQKLCVLEKLSTPANGHYLGSFGAHEVDDGSGVGGQSEIDIELDVIMVILDWSDTRDGLIDPPLELGSIFCSLACHISSL